MGANDDLRGLVPEGVPEAIAELGFELCDAPEAGADGSVLAVFDDRLSGGGVSLVTWDGGFEVRCLDGTGGPDGELRERAAALESRLSVLFAGWQPAAEANHELSGLVPEGVPEALAGFGLAVEEVREERGRVLAFLVDEELSLAHAEVLMTVEDGAADFRYLEADDMADTLALGYTEGDFERFEREMLEKVARLRSEVGARFSAAAM